jgi:serine/threonine-protein kinase
MTSNPPQSFVGETVDDRWKLVEQLGAGGMGVVYRAERVKLGRAVAIKFLDARAAASPEAVARFDREARAISRLRHRHVVDILDFGVWRRRPYIVMEYVAGRPLNKDMGKPDMTPRRAVRIMRQILEALRHAHMSGVVHRDLKPENVMLAESTGDNDYVKLLDFGLAIIVGDEQPSITMPRTIAGTPSYMSPEQARGERPDHRTDIYSCGVILFGMCTGQKPFRAEDPVTMLRMHMSAPVPSPRKVAPEQKISLELERVILRALEKDRDKRYFHAGEFLEALERVPEARARRTARPLGRVLAAALAILAVGGGAWAWRMRAHHRGQALMAAAPPAHGTPTLSAPQSPPLQPAPTPPTLTPPASTQPALTPTQPAPTQPTPAQPTPTQPTPAQPAPTQPAPTQPARASATAPDLASATVADAAVRPPEPPTAPAPVPLAVAPSTRQQVAQLIEGDKLAEAERILRAQAILEPRAGWVHLDLGEIYFRRLWRRDAEKEWELGLTLDPELKHDARLGEHLCVALGPSWKGTAQRLVLRHVGADAIAPLTECLRHADSLERLQAAARLIARVGRGKLDRELVAARTAELKGKRTP